VAVFSASSVDEWQQVSSTSFVPLQCHRVGATFAGTLEVRHLGSAMSLSHVVTDSVRVSRTARLATDSPSDELLLSVQLASSGRISQHGRDALLTPGAAVLYEANRPYEIDHRLPGQHQLIAKIDRSALGLPDHAITRACGQLLSPEQPRLRLFTSYASTLYEEAGNLSAGDSYEASIFALELLAALLRAEAGRTGRSEVRDLLTTLQSFVRTNLENADLSVETLAEHHHVSVRTIYNAFAPTGETPAVYIRKQRLKKATTLLSAPQVRERTVASIAVECGYADPSTFTRAFRREYGLSPHCLAEKRRRTSAE
jgi:AraC family transcriptional activator of tynA and feaB